MELVSTTPIIAMLWMWAAFVIGIGGIASSWTVLTSVAAVPPLVMLCR